MVVERVKQGAIDQVGGPDHGGWPDQEATGQTSQSVASAECSDAKQDLESPAKLLAVEDLLGKKHISCIKNAATIRSLGTELVPI